MARSLRLKAESRKERGDNVVESGQLNRALTVVGLGEALFDCFDEDRYVLGGAPLNLAVHAHQLLGPRGQGVVASRVGADDLGERVHEELARWGMPTEYVTATADYPTGTVLVEVDTDGQPKYEIRENVAWDHLEFTDAWGELAPACSAVCFGTLAQRSPESRAAMQEFLTNAPQALKVCDLNLRQFFYTADLLDECLQSADVLKLNEEELGVVSKALEIGDTVVEQTQGGKPERPKTVDALIKDYNLTLLAVTRGKLGTMLFTSDEQVEGTVPAYPRQPRADAVGAGDACGAGIIVGLLLGKTLEEIVELANHMGAYVASQAGATPILPGEVLAKV